MIKWKFCILYSKSTYLKYPPLNKKKVQLTNVFMQYFSDVNQINYLCLKM